MKSEMDPVGFTSRMTAAARARETARPDRLFEDSYAAELAGPEGFDFLDRHWRAFGGAFPSFELRTRFFDDYLLEAAVARQIRQVVLAAAGLDTRAFRLAWPPHVTVFELDQAEVLNYKAGILETRASRPQCRRTPVSVDLREDWRPKLLAAGYRPEEPSAWLVEGLAMYLPEHANERLLAEIAEISSPGGRLGLDVIPARVLSAADFVALYAERGHPVKYASDDPAPLLQRTGWRAECHNPMDVARALGRSFPAGYQRASGNSGYLLADRNAAA